MKATKTLLLVLLVLLSGALTAQAQLSLSLTPSTRAGEQGTTVIFSGTLRNTGSDEVFLNATNYNLNAAGLSLDDSPFFANAPVSLLGGQEWSGNLFNVAISPATALGTYSGNFGILGGVNSQAQDFLTQASFEVTVQSSPPPPPSNVSGSIFLTGHDPDFHAFADGGNASSAKAINKAAINFVMDPAFNPFVASGVSKFLFIESKGSVPGGHTNGVNGIIASGYGLGTNFDHHDFTTLNAALNGLGTTYSAIVVASDFGGILRQAELDILNARSSDIITFLNAGGGLYAMAESNTGSGLTPNGGQFGYLPFVTTTTPLNQTEVGVTVTPFGASLGLTNADVNGNFTHLIFTGTFGLQVVDHDVSGNILTLAGRGPVGPGGVGTTIPEPSTCMLLVAGLLPLFGVVARRKA